MTRIEIISRGISIPQAKVDHLAGRGIRVVAVLSSWLSAFTAMSVAREVDRQQADEVLVTRLKDAFAAISARKVAKCRFRIVYEVGPNTAVPKGIPSEVVSQVDLWRFPSQRLLEAYPSNLKATEVVDPECYDNCLDQLPCAPVGSPVVLWVGPIDGNVDHLKRAIDAVGNADAPCQLRILGTGRARYAMEAVRRSRGVTHPDRIVWLGDDGDLGSEAAACTHVCQSGPDPTDREIAIARSGRKLITYA